MIHPEKVRILATKWQPAWRTALCLLLVEAIAIAAFVVNRHEPAMPFWDENYYLTAAQRYLDGVDQFASHPPLGLILIASGEALIHANAGIDTRKVGEEKHIKGEDLPKGFSFRGLRLMPSIFAAGGALLFFGLMLSLTGRRDHALIFTGLYLCENAFMVHFAAVHLDGFQMFFALAALWCLAAAFRGLDHRSATEDLTGFQNLSGLARNGRNDVQGPFRRDLPRDNALDAGFGLAVGLATMVKANSVLLLGMGAWHLIRRAVRIAAASRSHGGASAVLRHRVWRVVRETIRGGLWMGVPFIAAVIAVFALHAALIRHPPDPATAAGRNDLPFVSSAHLAYARGERPLDAGTLFAVMSDYRAFMAADFKGIPKGQRKDSIPLLWPFHDITLNYRWDSANGLTRYLQLAGNPVGWGLGLLALLLSGGMVVGRRLMGLRMEETAGVRIGSTTIDPSTTAQPPAGFKPAGGLPKGEGAERVTDYALMEMLFLFYLLFMAVHVWMGTQRIMYLYHYFIPLAISYALLPLVWRRLCRVHGFSPRTRRLTLGAGLAGLITACLFVAPLSNHWPLTKEECEWRNVIFHDIPCQ